MFKQKKRREPAISTLVGKDTRVHGDVEFRGGCLVDGYVKGNVESVGDEDSMVSVSEQGCIEGTVAVPNVLLNGTVKGDVRASHRVELGSNARVIGNVQYSLIEMAIGAEVNGKLIHESETSREEDATENPSDRETDDARSTEPDSLSPSGQIAKAN